MFEVYDKQTRGYYVDMETPLREIPAHFSSWITKEIREGGLLEEVDKYCQTFRTEGTVESYEIWTHKQTWTPVEDETYTIGDTILTIDYPFVVAVIVAMTDDEEYSEQRALNIQAKAIMSVFKNIERQFDNIIINSFTIEEGYNDGDLTALNMEDSTIIKGFRVTLRVSFDWLECIQQHIRETEQQ